MPSSTDLEKAVKDRTKLIPVKKLVTRDGKTFYQTFLVSPAEAQAGGHSNDGVEFKEREEFKHFIKNLTTDQRQQLMELAKQQGINWDDSSPKTSWMRCAMAIGSQIDKGNGFRVKELIGEVKADKQPATPKQPSTPAQPKQPKANVSVQGTFTTRDDFKAYCKKLTTDQRREIMDDGLAQGLTWTRVTTNPATDWMRCAMAIGSKIEKGGSYTIAGNATPASTPPVQPSQPTPVQLPPKPTPSQPTPVVQVSQPAPPPTPPTPQPSQPTPTNGVALTKIGPLDHTVHKNGYVIGSIRKKGDKFVAVSGSQIVASNLNTLQEAQDKVVEYYEARQGSPIQPSQPKPLNPAIQATVNPITANPTPAPSNAPKIDQFFDALGIPHREENGNYIVGLGKQEVKNKWGNMETAPNSLRLMDIKPQPKWGAGNYIKLESSFLDKDKLKDQLGARWGGTADPNDKHWYIPFSNFTKTFANFKNVQIDASIAPTIKAVIDKHPIDALVGAVNGATPTKTISAKDNIDISNFVYPSGMKNMYDPSQPFNLYDHQKKGFKFLLQNKKTVLGLAVGLGKTLTAITALKQLTDEKKVKRALVISPASVKFNWKNEVEGFSDMKACVLSSDDLNNPKKAQQKWKEAEDSQVIIINYDMLRKPELRAKLQKLAPDCVIADEAHKLKNDTQQTKGFKDTWKNAQYKWFLTATPFPNGQPKETYNILHHLRPDKVGSWTKDFGKKYVVWESAGRFGAKAVSLKNEDKLAKEMEDVVFIRTQKSPDVNASMPNERHQTFNIEMTDAQKKMYKAIADEISGELKALEKAGIKATPAVMIAKMKKLEQVAIDPDMLQSDKTKIDMNKLYPKEEWAVNTITDHLQDPANRGVVVFCDMKMPLDKVRIGLENNKVRADQIAYITGNIKPEERTKIQQKMKTGEVKVVLCTNAAEEGVNLQHGAHTLIHLDVPWVPKAVTQREGRVLRQGQPSSYTNLWTPIMKGTVEDTKRGKLGVKIGTIEKLLGRGSAGSSRGNVASGDSAKDLSVSDIKNMLSTTGV